MITASNFRPVLSGTLRGFTTLTLSPSGIVLHECSLHERDDSRWIGLPGKPQIDGEGRHRRDTNGKGMWSPIVEIPDKDARTRFQDAALAAVDLLLGDESTPSADRGFGQRKVGVARTHPSARPSAFGSAPRRPQPSGERLPDDGADDLWRDDGGAP